MNRENKRRIKKIKNEINKILEQEQSNYDALSRKALDTKGRWIEKRIDWLICAIEALESSVDY